MLPMSQLTGLKLLTIGGLPVGLIGHLAQNQQKESLNIDGVFGYSGDNYSFKSGPNVDVSAYEKATELMQADLIKCQGVAFELENLTNAATLFLAAVESNKKAIETGDSFLISASEEGLVEAKEVFTDSIESAKVTLKESSKCQESL